jgi:hypothetical protein
MPVRREGPGTVKVLAAINGLDGLEGKTGWFETAHYPDGTPVAYVATIHEFGTPRTPARPFMRPAVADHGGEWIQLLGDGAKASLNGGPAPEQVLEMVTLAAAGNVAEKITALPPLTNAQTIKRKGFATALVDTGQMIQSVTGKVERT